MRLIDEMNPEKNTIVRATLYAIAGGGALHFVALLLTAVKTGNAVWFNPLFAIDFDRIFPGLKNNFLTFIGGWLLLALSTWTISTWLRKQKVAND